MLHRNRNSSTKMFSCIFILASLFFIFPKASSQQDINYFDYSFKTENKKEGVQIQVFSSESSIPIYSIILQDIPQQHIHPFEYHNGSLYVIHQSTSSLFRYDSKHIPHIIHSTSTRRFCVSPDERLLAITSNDSLIILSRTNRVLHIFSREELDLEDFGCLYIAGNHLFIEPSGVGIFSFDAIRVIDLTSFKWKIHDIPISMDMDYTFNPFNQIVVGSDYPFLYDTDSRDNWRAEQPKVILYLYSFHTRKLQLLDSTISERFYPTWIDNMHIKYINPSNGMPIVRSIAGYIIGDSTLGRRPNQALKLTK